MTNEEARRMAAVALEADSGCSVCVRGQIRRLITAFPDQHGPIMDVWLTQLPSGERESEFSEMLVDLEEGED